MKHLLTVSVVPKKEWPECNIFHFDHGMIPVTPKRVFTVAELPGEYFMVHHPIDDMAQGSDVQYMTSKFTVAHVGTGCKLGEFKRKNIGDAMVAGLQTLEYYGPERTLEAIHRFYVKQSKDLKKGFKVSA